MLKRSDSSMRWIVLTLNCVLMNGDYYCDELSAAIKPQLQDYMGSPSNFEFLFNLLYSIPATINIGMPLYSGYVLDTYGARNCLLVYVGFVAIGHSFYTMGLATQSWALLFMGRAVFGLGDGSTSVANLAILTSWFEGKELALALGLNLSASRFGSVINNLISPAIANAGEHFGANGVVLAGLTAMAVVFAAVVAAVGIYVIDKKADADIKHTRIVYKTPSLTYGSISSSDGHEQERGAAVQLSEIYSFSMAYKLLTVYGLFIYGAVIPFNNVASALLMERTYFRPLPSGAACALEDLHQCQGADNMPTNCPSTYRDESYSFWETGMFRPPLPEEIMIGEKYFDILKPADVDCSLAVWKEGCTEAYCDSFLKGINYTKVVMSIPYFMAACLLPLFGGLIDRFGNRANILLCSPIVLALVHTLLGSTDINPIYLMVTQGLVYCSFASAFWPSISMTVPPKYSGICFGIASSMQNVGLAIVPMIVAATYTSSGNRYIPHVEYLFVTVAMLSFCACSLLYIFDPVITAQLNGVQHNDGICTRSDAEISKENIKLLKEQGDIAIIE